MQRTNALSCYRKNLMLLSHGIALLHVFRTTLTVGTLSEYLLPLPEIIRKACYTSLGMRIVNTAAALLIAEVQGADEANGGTEILAFISRHGADLRCAAHAGNYLSMSRTLSNHIRTCASMRAQGPTASRREGLWVMCGG